MQSKQERQTADQRGLAAQVNSFRRRRGMKLQAVAAEIGCSVANVSRLLSGRIGMTAHHERAMRNMLAKVDLTTRQEDFVSLIARMRPEELDAAMQILQIMQKLGTEPKSDRSLTRN